MNRVIGDRDFEFNEFDESYELTDEDSEYHNYEGQDPESYGYEMINYEGEPEWLGEDSQSEVISTTEFGRKIEDFTRSAPKSKRIVHRDPRNVKALVMHQMALSRGDNPARYLNTTAHFAILPNGRIMQLHPISALLYASNGFNRTSVAVEFAGNLPDARGRYWRPDTFGRNKLTQAQIAAGRFLIKYLISKIGLKRIHAHRQAAGSRLNCPGPDIWYYVGQWAVDNLGLSDGGQQYKIGTGATIPQAWRDWGRRGRDKEYADETDSACEASDYEADAYESDYEIDEAPGPEQESHNDEEIWGTLQEGEGEGEDAFGEDLSPEILDEEFGENLEEPEISRPPFRKVRYGPYSGYIRSGGGRVHDVLTSLRRSGRINISDQQLDLLSRISGIETGGNIQAINSYDSAIMSMGLLNWTIRSGQLQNLIARAPAAFRKYGIELYGKYRFGNAVVPGIKGAGDPQDLRNLTWAQRFYRAGLDPDIITAEVKHALDTFRKSREKMVRAAGEYFLPYYRKSPVLRALLHETVNSRPAYAYAALKRAVQRAMKTQSSVSLQTFMSFVRNAIRDVFGEKEKNGASKADKIIAKTARLAA